VTPVTPPIKNIRTIAGDVELIRNHIAVPEKGVAYALFYLEETHETTVCNAVVVLRSADDHRYRALRADCDG
jgi:hypothetical protein